MADLALTAHRRMATGRKVKQLRAQGLVPAIVYGKTTPAENLQIDVRSLERVLHSGGMSLLLELNVEGGSTHNALVRSVQRHPVTHQIQHADFYAVDMTEKQHVSIPIELVGKVSDLGAGMIVLQVLDQASVEALPADIPAKVELDISPLTLDRALLVADLPELPGVAYLDDADEHVVTLTLTRAEVEPEVEGVAEEPEVLSEARHEEEEEEEEEE